MTLAALALALTLGQTRYIFELDHAPVGTVELSLDGQRYSYRSTHAYRRSEATRVEGRDLDGGGPMPEGLWLWHRPKPGCVDGIAELSHQTGRLCAESLDGGTVNGTTLGRPFAARYDADAELVELTVGKSRFLRTSAPLMPGQPYASGFAIEGKGRKLTLEPEVTGARWPERAPLGTRTSPVAQADACLELAQAFAAASGGKHVVVLGLVVEGARAYPHAWVRSEKGGELDPSAKAESRAQPNRAYLELPADRAGALYVELLEGKRRLKWK